MLKFFNENYPKLALHLKIPKLSPCPQITLLLACVANGAKWGPHAAKTSCPPTTNPSTMRIWQRRHRLRSRSTLSAPAEASEKIFGKLNKIKFSKDCKKVKNLPFWRQQILLPPNTNCCNAPVRRSQSANLCSSRQKCFHAVIRKAVVKRLSSGAAHEPSTAEDATEKGEEQSDTAPGRRDDAEGEPVANAIAVAPVTGIREIRIVFPNLAQRAIDELAPWT